MLTGNIESLTAAAHLLFRLNTLGYGGKVEQMARQMEKGKSICPPSPPHQEGSV